nr:hypothetical protein [Anaerolineae bacterium]NIN99523.1 hypothetical protein [Anaerolineae bacterium]NIQ82384.1 hypothetical protein [Anaerolineae bacterium]
SPATGGQVPRGMPGHSAEIALPYDPGQARELLSAGGYPEGRGFPEVELLMARGREAVGDYLQAQWQANLGVQIRCKTMEWAELLERLNKTPPHLYGMAAAALYPDPESFLGPTGRDDHGGYYAWRDEAYNRLVEEARRATDQPERVRSYQQADRILVNEAWILPLLYERRHSLVKPWVVKLPTSAIMLGFWKDVIIEAH